ncbi:tRNA threonylcarbamoyladenosine dehydratase [Fluviicola sp.]|uniref:tRNA threonylcarbamoyladenosine dehydratase n=1 Tax=Fluviicola sp. TaxID=1917219 RepID=UPI00262FF073|nr:tRNA threonylcarbamoyladenosine dehydratase [Fluviicola sp.]
MSKWLERTELILGPDEMNRLKSAHVLIVGLGGIGSFAAEFIARAGVGTMTIVDGDAFDITNKNRQLTALDSTIGRNKAVVLAERIKDINPDIQLNVVEEFVLPERVWELLDQYKPNYVMDCIDSVTPKLEWIVACKSKKIKVITHLGAGGKIDPTRVHVAKLPDSHNCKLGAHVKKRLKKKGVRFEKIKCVYSSELQQKDSLKMTDGSNFKRSFYGTVSYMPALFGLMGAAEVIRHLSQKETRESNAFDK